MLVKHQVRLDHNEAGDPITEEVCFETPKGSVFSESGDPITEGYYMPLAIWEDMGKPEEITLTVEPGDHLNR